MNAKRITWMCVADANQARILARITPRSKLAAVTTLIHEEGYAHGRHEAPGRSQESATTARHSFVDADGPVRREKREFAHEVADYLNRAAARGEFDELVVAAPARFLGDLRATLDAPARRRVAAEIIKDLTKETEAELDARLADLPRA